MTTLKQIAYLVSMKDKLHPNDSAHSTLSAIMDTLLLLDQRCTIDIIEGIEHASLMESVSNHFPRISGKFQSWELIHIMQTTGNKFQNSAYYKFIQENIAEAIAAMDEAP